MKEKATHLAWPFSFYFLLYAVVATYAPYQVLFYQFLNFSGTQIGLLVGIAPLIMLVTLPMITGIADRTNQHRQVMSISILVMIFGLFIFPYLRSFYLQLTLAIILSVSLSPILTLSNSATMFMLGEKKDLFGRIRLGGTIGFSIFATLSGALVENYGLKIAFWGAALLLILTFLLSQKLIHNEEEAQAPVSKGRGGEMLKNPHFLIFLLIGFAGGISFAALNIYLFPYMKALKAGESLMGLALTIGTISEIPILFFVDHFIRRFTAFRLLIFSIAMTGLRFLLMGVTNNPLMVLAIQLLNGFNFPLLTVAGVNYADEHAPQGFRSTAQGLFNAAMSGIGSAAGGFIGGLLFESLGAKNMYLILCAFLAIVVGIVLLISRRLAPEMRSEKAIQEKIPYS
jgi:MFS transporter, PPP family, 3-phenylpropionic acid transporter